jgi:hypothetical protein
MVIFLSQTERNPKHFLEKKKALSDSIGKVTVSTGFLL